MISKVIVKSVPPRGAAVVRDRLRWSELGSKLIPLLDRVYAVVRAGHVAQGGHNIFIYRDGTREGVSVEVGVEVAAPFEAAGDVSYCETPAGDAAMTVHTGPYSGLGAAHEAVISWCRENDRARAGVWWEVYGDWQEDPQKLQTEVYYAVLPKS